MTDPEAIARGLTKAQREALLMLNGYHDPNTIRALRRKGLYDRGLLTGLGSQVCDVLMRDV